MATRTQTMTQTSQKIPINNLKIVRSESEVEPMISESERVVMGQSKYNFIVEKVVQQDVYIEELETKNEVKDQLQLKLKNGLTSLLEKKDKQLEEVKRQIRQRDTEIANLKKKKGEKMNIELPKEDPEVKKRRIKQNVEKMVAQGQKNIDDILNKYNHD